MGHTVIHSGAIVKHCIVAENVEIGEGAIVGSMPDATTDGVATIASGVHIGKNARIGCNAMVRENVKEGESHD